MNQFGETITEGLPMLQVKYMVETMFPSVISGRQHLARRINNIIATNLETS